MTLVSASRMARAETRRKAELAQQERAREALNTRYGEENRRSEVEAQAERMAVVTLWPSLASALGWYKREWQGALSWELHKGGKTVEPGDALGAPELTDRWRNYLVGRAGTGIAAEPIRVAMRDMASSTVLDERDAAAFLFVLACMDFDVVSAGLRVHGHCLCDPRDELGRILRDDTTHEQLVPHASRTGCTMRILPIPPEHVRYYAETAIRRLQERVIQVERRKPRALPEPGWKQRTGMSEAQSMAEAEIA